MLDLCMFAEGMEEQERMIAIGDSGALEVGIPSATLTFSPRVKLGQPKQVERSHIATDPVALRAGHHHGATYFQLLAFLRAAAGEGPVAVTAADGLAAVAMGVAAERSAAEHRVVEMQEL
jgi:predicted dehydrogenase